MTDTLAERAVAFAKTYTALVDALLAEGLPEEQSRIEARAAATTVLIVGTEEARESSCPLCGH